MKHIIPLISGLCIGWGVVESLFYHNPGAGNTVILIGIIIILFRIEINQIQND